MLVLPEAYLRQSLPRQNFSVGNTSWFRTYKLVLPPLLLVSGMEGGLPAQFAHVPMDIAATTLTVPALPIHPKGTELGLRLG